MRKILAGILVSSGLVLATSTAFANGDRDGNDARPSVPPLTTSTSVDSAAAPNSAVVGAATVLVGPARRGVLEKDKSRICR